MPYLKTMIVVVFFLLWLKMAITKIYCISDASQKEHVKMFSSAHPPCAQPIHSFIHSLQHWAQNLKFMLDSLHELKAAAESAKQVEGAITFFFIGI